MEEKKVETTNSNGDWSDDYKGEREETSNTWFKDAVPEGEISFKANITFEDEGTKTQNNYNETVIRFSILVESEGETKTYDIKTSQFDILKSISEAKPITGKTALLERTGTTRKDTRRSIKFN